MLSRSFAPRSTAQSFLPAASKASKRQGPGPLISSVGTTSTTGIAAFVTSAPTSAIPVPMERSSRLAMPCTSKLANAILPAGHAIHGTGRQSMPSPSTLNVTPSFGSTNHGTRIKPSPLERGDNYIDARRSGPLPPTPGPAGPPHLGRLAQGWGIAPSPRDSGPRPGAHSAQTWAQPARAQVERPAAHAGTADAWIESAH
jgi:hypothetical protein